MVEVRVFSSPLLLSPVLGLRSPFFLPSAPPLHPCCRVACMGVLRFLSAASFLPCIVVLLPPAPQPLGRAARHYVPCTMPRSLYPLPIAVSLLPSSGESVSNLLASVVLCLSWSLIRPLPAIVMAIFFIVDFYGKMLQILFRYKVRVRHGRVALPIGSSGESSFFCPYRHRKKRVLRLLLLVYHSFPLNRMYRKNYLFNIIKIKNNEED